jgi:hypothetical protein
MAAAAKHGPFFVCQVAAEASAAVSDETFDRTDKPEVDRSILGARKRVPIRTEVEITDEGIGGSQPHQQTIGRGLDKRKALTCARSSVTSPPAPIGTRKSAVHLTGCRRVGAQWGPVLRPIEQSQFSMLSER